MKELEQAAQRELGPWGSRSQATPSMTTLKAVAQEQSPRCEIRQEVVGGGGEVREGHVGGHVQLAPCLQLDEVSTFDVSGVIATLSPLRITPASALQHPWPSLVSTVHGCLTCTDLNLSESAPFCNASIAAQQIRVRALEADDSHEQRRQARGRAQLVRVS